MDLTGVLGLPISQELTTGSASALPFRILHATARIYLYLYRAVQVLVWRYIQ